MRLLLRVDTWKVALQRLIPIAVLSALCLCASAPGSPTLAAPVAQASIQGKSLHRSARVHHHARCAKRSSFHSRSGHVHHVSHPAKCKKRRSAAHHKARPHRRHTRRLKTHRRIHHQAKAPSLYGYQRTAPAPLSHYGNCPDTTLVPNANNLDRVRAAVLCLVNRERTDRGESPLAPDARLQQAAQAHTESMAFRNYFEHTGPQGETPLSRIRATGYIYSSQMGYEVGENIGWGTLWMGTPRAIVAAWMASSGHRANILDAHFRNTGVGVSPHPPASLSHHRAGGIYTQDFGVLIKG